MPFEAILFIAVVVAVALLLVDRFRLNSRNREREIEVAFLRTRLQQTEVMTKNLTRRLGQTGRVIEDLHNPRGKRQAG